MTDSLKPYTSLMIVIFIFIIVAMFLYLYVPGIVNSNFFMAFVTFLVGSFVIYLYIKQKNDYKRDAASIILMEIRHAEKVVERMKMSGITVSVSIDSILPTNNWSKYNYLFIKDFDQDELELINNFYNQCSLIDNALMQINLSRQLEQKANYIHQSLVQMARDSISDADFENKKNQFLPRIEKESYVFKPRAPLDEIVKGLNNLRFVTTTTAGEKMKRIARIK